EQPGGEFAFAGAATRAEDAALQIARISATVPVRSRRRPQCVQRSAPSCFPQHAPRPPRRSLPELAGSVSGMNSSQVVSTLAQLAQSSRDNPGAGRPSRNRRKPLIGERRREMKASFRPAASVGPFGSVRRAVLIDIEFRKRSAERRLAKGGACGTLV